VKATVLTKLRKALTSSRAKKIYFALALVLVLVVVCDSIVLPWLVRRGGVIEVPNVVGMRLEGARSVLDSLGLQAREGQTRPDLHYPKGTVALQVPLPGSKVRPGRRVYLLISGGEPVVEVPLLRGRSLRDAKFALERVGLSLGGEEFVPSDEFPPNTVIDQSTAAGSMVRKGSSISVVISQGKESDRIIVPNLIGRILPEAQKLLLQRGLKLGNVSFQESLELLPNTVLEQYPRAGDLVGLGQPVDLFVARAGPEKPKEFREN